MTTTPVRLQQRNSSAWNPTNDTQSAGRRRDGCRCGAGHCPLQLDVADQQLAVLADDCEDEGERWRVVGTNIRGAAAAARLRARHRVVRWRRLAMAEQVVSSPVPPERVDLRLRGGGERLRKVRGERTGAVGGRTRA